MARVTVEDCVDKVPNRFDLVLLAAQRARQISSGADLTIDRDRDKNPVVALREIADETVRPANLKEAVIRSSEGPRRRGGRDGRARLAERCGRGPAADRRCSAAPQPVGRRLRISKRAPVGLTGAVTPRPGTVPVGLHSIQINSPCLSHGRRAPGRTCADGPPVAAIGENDPRFRAPILRPIAEGHNYRDQGLAFGRQRIDHLARSDGSGLPFQDAAGNQLPQPVGEDVAGDPEARLEFLEMAQVVERAAQDQERPFFADQLDRCRNGARQCRLRNRSMRVSRSPGIAPFSQAESHESTSCGAWQRWGEY